MTTDITFKNQFINQFGLKTFHNAIVKFREKYNSQGLTASEHILYNILRDLPANRGFTPITNLNKINNGADINGGFRTAKFSLSYDPKGKSNYTKDPLKTFELPEESREYFMTKLNSQ